MSHHFRIRYRCYVFHQESFRFRFRFLSHSTLHHPPQPLPLQVDSQTPQPSSLPRSRQSLSRRRCQVVGSVVVGPKYFCKEIG